MKPSSRTIVAVVLGLAFASIGCSPAKGACTSSSDPAGDRCLPDATVGLCRTILGDGATFHEGLTCQDLGFPATDVNQNQIVGGITGIS